MPHQDRAESSQYRNGNVFGRGLYAFLLDTGKLAVALGAIGGVIWFGAQWAARDWMELPEQVQKLVTANEDGAEAVKKMQDEVARLSEGRAPPFLEFDDGAVAEPSKVKPGGTTVVLYPLLRRNYFCDTTSERRWWSLTDRAYDQTLTEIARVITSPVTQDFGAWYVVITVPMLAPGIWYFAPILRCSDEVVHAPWARIEVTP